MVARTLVSTTPSGHYCGGLCQLGIPSSVSHKFKMRKLLTGKYPTLTYVGDTVGKYYTCSSQALNFFHKYVGQSNLYNSILYNRITSLLVLVWPAQFWDYGKDSIP